MAPYIRMPVYINLLKSWIASWVTWFYFFKKWIKLHWFCSNNQFSLLVYYCAKQKCNKVGRMSWSYQLLWFFFIQCYTWSLEVWRKSHYFMRRPINSNGPKESMRCHGDGWRFLIFIPNSQLELHHITRLLAKFVFYQGGAFLRRHNCVVLLCRVTE